MATLTSVTNHFAKPKEGFITTLSSTIAVAAATVPLTSTSGLTNGDIFVGIIDPTTSAKQAFTGTVDTAGNQITGVVWTEGTNVGHTVGATVVDYVAATTVGMISKGVLVEHSQTGVHAKELITSRTEDTSPDVGADFLLSYDTSATALKKVKPTSLGIATGWVAGQLPAVSSVTENGNRSADITFASTVASILTPGMRIRTSRTVAAPTGAILLNGSTQYASKASPANITFTNNFVCSAWVRMTAYQDTTILSKYSSASGGFIFSVNSAGRPQLQGLNGGSANQRYVSSYQSIPLNKWVHIAIQIDMTVTTNSATTNYVMIDGVDVPAVQSALGTSPTSLTQAGNLEIGSQNGGLLPFPGNIAQAAIYSAKVTQATIRASKNQTLSGSETSLNFAAKLDQASGLNDLTANANNLTATGSPTYSVASPFTTDANGVPGGTYDWAIVTKVATTVATVQYPEGCAIPTSGGISTVDYSGVKSPFGMPVARTRWQILTLIKTDSNNGASTADTFYNVGSMNLTVPIGDYTLKGIISGQATTGSALTHGFTAAIATSAGNFSDVTRGVTSYITNLNGDSRGTVNLETQVTPLTSTIYYVNIASYTSAAAGLYIIGGGIGADTRLIAELSYL